MSMFKNRFVKQYAVIACLTLLIANRVDADDAAPASNDAATFQIPMIATFFQKFEDRILRWDDEYLYIESNGIPDHPMMTGITSWQQQVPLPQNYTGSNAFQIPLTPEYLDTPVDAPFMGAIAVAVNGIPIFHHLTQSGVDAYLNGELDEYGGHCGRADDYHYHLPPMHLQEIVGEGQPIAFGLDGIPVYASNPAVDKPLDSAHGYFDDNGEYRYVGTGTAPYMIGGYRGVANLEHQPHADPLRPAQDPLRDAVITGFTGSLEDGYELQYTLNNQVYKIQYKVNEDGSVDFDYISPDGSVRSETFRPRPTRIRDFRLFR